MTVIAPDDRTRAIFQQRHVPFVTQQDARREEIRALRIGIVNVLAHTEEYEASLLQPLGRSVMQIQPIWIRLHTRRYSDIDREHLERDYCPFDEAMARPLDGLILAGTPIEGVAFEELPYWEEVRGILASARADIPFTLGISWGALAMATFLGIARQERDERLFGVFEVRNLQERHPIMGALDDSFWCPQNRRSGVADDVFELRRDTGDLNLLAYAELAGYVIAETVDSRFCMHFGNPEYEASALAAEYRRLKERNPDMRAPENFDSDNPVNRWRGHRTCFFQQWIKTMHETLST
jgi:homoserine O-succinyltransferase